MQAADTGRQILYARILYRCPLLPARGFPPNFVPEEKNQLSAVGRKVNSWPAIVMHRAGGRRANRPRSGEEPIHTEEAPILPS